MTYSLAESGKNLFEQKVLQDLPTEQKEKLQNTYESVADDAFRAEEVRKAFQLAVLKGMKEATQPHHEMTPDAVALFMSYLMNKLTDGKETLSILDPALGTGNLLTAVLNGAQQQRVASYAVEADELLMKLAYVNANLQNHETEFFHQDALQPLLIDPVDAVVCDLPIGYYPDDERASAYALQADSGRSYTHHLMIEQSLNHTKEGGFLLFLIPNGLFQSDQTEALNAFIKQHAVIQGLLQLPLTMFKKEQHAKSIFILQKLGPGVKPPKQALLADLPSFSDEHALRNIITQIDEWFRGLTPE